MLVPPQALRHISAVISHSDERRILDFIQGAVYGFCADNPRKMFYAKDLFGNNNENWQGTPLQILCDAHLNSGKTSEAAFDAAGKDVGWLLLRVLSEDVRTYQNNHGGYTKSYERI